MEQWDMRSKYVRRDPKLWHMSFAQFARMLEAKNESVKKKKDEPGLEGENDEAVDQLTEEKDSENLWYKSFHNVMLCNGRGLVTFSKGDFIHQEDRVEENFQITKFSSNRIDSIHIYRSVIIEAI